LCASVERRGCNVSRERLGNWEHTVEKLRRKGQNLSEKEEDRGWSGVPPMLGKEMQTWAIEKQWGIQEAVDEEVVPPEVKMKVVKKVKVVRKTLETKKIEHRVKRRVKRASVSK
jgi:hypothetical protein